MSVRKPLQPIIKQSVNPVNVDALIEKGAKVKEDIQAPEAKKWTIINVRLQTEMLKEVDEAVQNRVGIQRNGWILEAIHEKLKL